MHTFNTFYECLERFKLFVDKVTLSPLCIGVHLLEYKLVAFILYLHMLENIRIYSDA